MPQSAVPDVNTKFIIYTREAINGWKNHNYDSAIGSLNAFNGLLPDKEGSNYRVVVDTELYNQKTKQDLVMICRFCEPDVYDESKEIKWENVKKVIHSNTKIIQVVPPIVVQILSNIEYEEVWYCPVCKKENRLSDTRMFQQILKDPTFLAVVPKPPTKKDGIIDRTQFYTKFTVWFWTFLTELEAQAARFRQEYKGKEDEMVETLEMQDTGETKDI